MKTIHKNYEATSPGDMDTLEMHGTLYQAQSERKNLEQIARMTRRRQELMPKLGRRAAAEITLAVLDERIRLARLMTEKPTFGA